MAVAGLQNFSCYSLSSVGEFCYDCPALSSRHNDDMPKTPGSCHSRKGPEFIGDCIGSFRSGMNGSSSDGVRSGGSETEHDDNLSCFSESSDVERIGRDRVRQVFQEWMKNGRFVNSSDSLHGTSSQGERIKQIRSQQRNEREGVGYRDSGASLQINQVRNGMSAQRPIRRICGRQTLSDLLHRAQQERKGDLKALLERKPVSGFAHRNRIQAFLRGRFLRNEKVIPEKKPSSVAVMELGMLKQRRTVSGLREEFLTKSPLINSLSGDGNISESESTCKETVTTGNRTVSEGVVNSTIELADADHHVSSHQKEGTSSIQELSVDAKSVHVVEMPVIDVEEEREPTEMSRETRVTGCNEDREYSNGINQSTDMEEVLGEHCDSLGSSSDLNEDQRTADGTSEELTNEETSENGAQMLELGVEWANQDFQESVESWVSLPYMENGESSRTSSVFRDGEDLDRYTELRELFGRKRVSTLVQGSFGKRLNQILQARVQLQGFVSSDLESNISSSSLTTAEQNRREENEDQASALFDSLFPSSHCFQEAELFSNQQIMDWVVVNEVRIDMARLQKKMNTIQNMLGDCLNMQSELQRAIHQEVSAASVLNHSVTSTDNSIQDTEDQESYWEYLRRGICCVCHNSSIDSLLYRCGHMCSCSKCAEELVMCTGKCPICRSPVLDMFRTR